MVNGHQTLCYTRLGLAVKVLAGNRWCVLVGSLIVRVWRSKSMEPLVLRGLKGQEERVVAKI